MKRHEFFSRGRLGIAVVVVLLLIGRQSVREWQDGTGSVPLSVAFAGFGALVVLTAIDLVVSVVREFRRGLAGERGPRP